MRAFSLFLFATLVTACEAPDMRPVEMAPSRPAEPPVTRAQTVARKPYVAPADCSDAFVEHALAIHAGKGERHPVRVALEEKLATCPQPGSASPSKCADVAAERLTLSHELGPRHPRMEALAFVADLCKDVPLPAPKPVDCEEVKARRHALIASGKGENHPLVVAAESALRECPR